MSTSKLSRRQTQHQMDAQLVASVTAQLQRVHFDGKLSPKERGLLKRLDALLSAAPKTDDQPPVEVRA